MPPKSKKNQNQELAAGQIPEKKTKPLTKRGRKKKELILINNDGDVEIQKVATVPAKRGRKKKETVSINNDDGVNKKPLMVPVKQSQKKKETILINDNNDVNEEPDNADVEDSDEEPEMALDKPLAQRPTIPLTDSISKLLEMSDDDFSEGNFLC